ncbi:hypothetical protein [Flavobacterium sp. 28A]|uniref:hypothetical protein n=1 Tax=Flavobacterium sp. 28A TaxID=2735895 RepID=UPI00156F55A4|nr:hypothetical protein [Flavobacterium sp. 28A]
MQKSTTLFLLISFTLLVLLNSCGSNPVRQMNEKAVDTKVYNAPYFSNTAMDYVYKANIAVYGNELSGIFIVKKLNETTHRVVFTTEFGNKLMDFEISDSDFKVNSIVKELDRKILINTLKKDFRILLKKTYAVDKQFEDDQNIIYESKMGRSYNYLYLSKTGGGLLKIVHASKRKEKIIVYCTSENNIFAEKIVIQHQNIKLRIELNYFNNQ